MKQREKKRHVIQNKTNKETIVENTRVVIFCGTVRHRLAHMYSKSQKMMRIQAKKVFFNAQGISKFDQKYQLTDSRISITPSRVNIMETTTSYHNQVDGEKSSGQREKGHTTQKGTTVRSSNDFSRASQKKAEHL